MALPTIPAWAKKKKRFERAPVFPCEACGGCCKKLFANGLRPESNERAIFQKLDSGRGSCKYFDFLNNRCKIYNTRPWLCRRDVLWKKYYKPVGISVDFTYAMFKKVCKILQTKDVIEDGDIDWNVITQEVSDEQEVLFEE